jgi:hypothetical protein
MALYLVICIYQAIKDRPYLASCFLTLGLGIKAGVLLIIPGFLGSVQMNYGIVKLLGCIIIILLYQVATAYVFVAGDSTLDDYLLRSKLTGQGRNGIASTIS